ncbi:MAG: biosynthetic-type acetolactate synthase large subunit [Bacteroidales bacterium]|nr:biosynthetic-type acetolactate synthase large subunit [Bacteroidales bacterium]
MDTINGSEALIKSLIAEGVKTIFGYPGGQIIPVFDKLYSYKDKVNHILVRHEQGAVHAAQGFARVSGEPGVVIVTSGPGATNVLTGVADAMIDSTPLVVITGQVPAPLLGSDSFQETDVVGVTLPITKWSYQIRKPEEIAWAVARAFYIAKSGRPGPVVLDFPKDVQIGNVDFEYKKCDYIRSYQPNPIIDYKSISQAASMINGAKKPFLIFGQGIILSHAEQELKDFIEKSGIPCACTLLGLSALASDFKQFKGMVGMHGNLGPNKKTNECDVLIAVGMRFDDRVTSDVNTYAKQAKIIHIDIDPSEIGKNIPVEIGILGNAKDVLNLLIEKVDSSDHSNWSEEFDALNAIENEKVTLPETKPESGYLNMGEIVDKVSQATANSAIIVTDVGQNQMMAARYSKFTITRSLITSGGLGTMGFGLPAAIGAKIASPEREVCFFTGDGGIQMTLQELGTIMQENTAVKIIVLNNNWLGMVRQWQELFFNERYSETRMVNPDFVKLAEAYGIKAETVGKREEIDDAIKRMIDHKGAYLLNVNVVENGMVFPMIPGGKCVSKMMLSTKEWY